MSDAVDMLRPGAHEPPEPPEVPTPGPLLQSVVIGFRAVYVAIGLMAVVWLVSNVSVISPGNQAVVLQFGRIVRSQDTGLLIALPRPIEEIRQLPGPARQLSQTVSELPPIGGIAEGGGDLQPAKVIADPFLTGDGNLVLLHATLLYRISDAKAYVLAEKHVGPALDRLFHSVAVRVAAGRNLNDFLVVRTTGPDSGSVTALRQAVLDDLVSAMNARLAALASANSGLGVEIQRIDMTAVLPQTAKFAFDSVLTAIQGADQTIAAARTDAEQQRQMADRDRDRLLSDAEATASEMIANAKVDTAAILALSKEATAATHSSVVWRAYREHVATVISKAGSVTLVDPKNGARLILPGRQ